MRVVRYHAPADLRVEDVPDPTAGDGEVVIRVHACSVAATDLEIYRFGHPRLRPPRVLGHEVAGEIVQTGSAVRGWHPGDRVQVIGAIPDGTCAHCRRAAMTVCPNQEFLGHHYDGGFAEYLVVPATVLQIGGLNRIPDNVEYDEASVAEPLARVLNGQELAGVGPGQDVVVIGAGAAGCLHVRLARARGAARVFLVDGSSSRLALSAHRVRPDEAIAAEVRDPVEAVTTLTDGRGADVVLVAASTGADQEQALRLVARRAVVGFFGGRPRNSPNLTVDADLVHDREVSLVGANGASPAHNAAALDLIASYQVPVADLITHRLPLADLERALRVAASGEALKVTVEP